jgi:hypothetical protein
MSADEDYPSVPENEEWGYPMVIKHLLWWYLQDGAKK